jgi:hypothetical protein
LEASGLRLYCRVPDDRQLSLLRSSVREWNAWRAHSDTVPDLEGADLRGANLFGANLANARLSRAVLNEAVLSLADLSGAVLSSAGLLDARLVQANLRGTDLSHATLVRAHVVESNLTGAELTGADLSYTSLIAVDLSGARLRDCLVYGVGAWDLTVDAATDQRDLVVSRGDEPRVTVDDLEVAQFIRLMMTHEKLRNTLNAVTRRTVLLLGRFGGGGVEDLRHIAQTLRRAGYLPMLFDFERPTARTYTETIQTLAALARFVIADLSGPSVPQELYATVPHFKIPFVPITKAASQPYAMFVDLLAYPWVLEPVVYASLAQLIETMQEQVIAPAEAKHAERQALLDRLFGR